MTWMTKILHQHHIFFFVTETTFRETFSGPAVLPPWFINTVFDLKYNGLECSIGGTCWDWFTAEWKGFWWFTLIWPGIQAAVLNWIVCMQKSVLGKHWHILQIWQFLSKVKHVNDQTELQFLQILDKSLHLKISSCWGVWSFHQRTFKLHSK